MTVLTIILGLCVTSVVFWLVWSLLHVSNMATQYEDLLLAIDEDIVNLTLSVDRARELNLLADDIRTLRGVGK